MSAGTMLPWSTVGKSGVSTVLRNAMSGENDASMNPGTNEAASEVRTIKKPPQGGFFMRGEETRRHGNLMDQQMSG